MIDNRLCSMHVLSLNSTHPLTSKEIIKNSVPKKRKEKKRKKSSVTCLRLRNISKMHSKVIGSDFYTTFYQIRQKD